MKIKSMRFEIRASVEFTKKDIEDLILCSMNHYDGECQRLSKPGGLLYGLNNKITMCSTESTQCGVIGDAAEWTLSITEIDLLAKCAEYGKYIDEVDPMLFIKIGRVLNEMQLQQREANGEPDEN
jgi:hypothetical protein